MLRSIAWFALAAVACQKSGREKPDESAAVELQGHRGARGLAPENTIAAARVALAVGVDTLEMDVHLTADGVAVVYHDPALKPETTRDANGRWVAAHTFPLRSLTLAQLAPFDVGTYQPGSGYARRFPRAKAVAGEHIPTLDALIADAERISGGVIKYNIETKLVPEQSDADARALADAVVAAIKARKLGSRADVQSFDWRSLKRVAEIAPDIARVCLTSRGANSDTVEVGRPGPSKWTAGLDVDDHRGSVPALVKAAGCSAWSPSAFSINRGEVARAHELGLRVITWTVNKPDDIERVIDMGVDGIITDEPDRAREVMARRGMQLPTSFVVAN